MPLKAASVKLSQDVTKLLRKKQNLLDLAKLAHPSNINKTNAIVDSKRNDVCYFFELHSSVEEQATVRLKDGGDWKNYKVIIEADGTMKRTYYQSKADSSYKRFVAHLYRKKVMLVIYHQSTATRVKDLNPRKPRTAKRVLEEEALKKQQGTNVPFASNYPADFIHSDHSYLRILASKALAKTPDCISSSERSTKPAFGDLYVFRLEDLSKAGLTIRQDGKNWVSYRTRRDQGSNKEDFLSRVWIKMYSEQEDASSKKCVITFSSVSLVLIYYYKVCCNLKLSSRELEYHLYMSHSKSMHHQLSGTCQANFVKPFRESVSYQNFTQQRKEELCKIAAESSSASFAANLIYPVSGSVYVFRGQPDKMLDGNKWYVVQSGESEQIYKSVREPFYRSLEYFPKWNMTIVRYFESCLLCGEDLINNRFGDKELEQHLDLMHSEIFKINIMSV